MSQYSLRKVINCIWLVVVLALSGTCIRDTECILPQSLVEDVTYLTEATQRTPAAEMLGREKTFDGSSLVGLQEKEQLRSASYGRGQAAVIGMFLLMFPLYFLSLSAVLRRQERKVVPMSLRLVQYMKKADGEKARGTLHRITE